MAGEAGPGTMKRILQNRWLSILIRIALGAIFLFSAAPKIADPPAFAQMIWNYQVLPSFVINVLAMVLPWLELFAGIALITGVLRRGAALTVGGMLIVFIAAIAFNLVRGNPIDCGCFSLSAVQQSRDELLTGMKLDILRDLGILLMALQVLFTPVTWTASCSGSKSKHAAG